MLICFIFIHIYGNIVHTFMKIIITSFGASEKPEPDRTGPDRCER